MFTNNLCQNFNHKNQLCGGIKAVLSHEKCDFLNHFQYDIVK